MGTLTIKELMLKVIEYFSDGIMGSAEYEPNLGNLQIAATVIKSKADDVSMAEICSGMSQEVGNEVMCAMGDYYAYSKGTAEEVPEESAMILNYAQQFCEPLYKDLTEDTYMMSYRIVPPVIEEVNIKLHCSGNFNDHTPL